GGAGRRREPGGWVLRQVRVQAGEEADGEADAEREPEHGGGPLGARRARERPRTERTDRPPPHAATQENQRPLSSQRAPVRAPAAVARMSRSSMPTRAQSNHGPA